MHSLACVIDSLVIRFHIIKVYFGISNFKPLSTYALLIFKQTRQYVKEYYVTYYLVYYSHNLINNFLPYGLFIYRIRRINQ